MPHRFFSIAKGSGKHKPLPHLPFYPSGRRCPAERMRGPHGNTPADDPPIQ
ncbi:hypothetical protein IE4771_CH00932 [Rhizobium etli bv. mimosae str. IE4771]|uniref:Uncharacterized protein n=1 Tax=Rhizobium etli bv. mimosae str. IE4771 TaxID=1432050 RepID=A0A060I3R4_RHIET|nr:hypothetical protein IE4771_CH00932 [Rhizobium sp. IE4771]